MVGKRIPKMILESNIIGKRPVGKPTKRWANAVETVERFWKLETGKENL
jgi:hypothetical protein